MTYSEKKKLFQKNLENFVHILLKRRFSGRLSQLYKNFYILLFKLMFLFLLKKTDSISSFMKSKVRRSLICYEKVRLENRIEQ